MADGGYDAGYSATDCFWGTDAASLVREFLASNNASGLRVLDVGCGEGKNANAFALVGSRVMAVDCSELAIHNGKNLFPSNLIDWQVADVTTLNWRSEAFDIVVSYGLFHCLPNVDVAAQLISQIQRSTKPGGFNIFCTFNDRSQDLSAHPGFSPLLLNHDWYLDHYADWTIQKATDSDLHETHPHNLIPHHHSLTRVIAKKHA